MLGLQMWTSALTHNCIFTFGMTRFLMCLHCVHSAHTSGQTMSVEVLLPQRCGAETSHESALCPFSTCTSYYRSVEALLPGDAVQRPLRITNVTFTLKEW